MVIFSIGPVRKDSRRGKMFEMKSPVEKVFDGCYHVLGLIIDHLPHIQWPRLRAVNKRLKFVVEEKLFRLERFYHKFGPDNKREVYSGLLRLTPNLVELPCLLESEIRHGGFHRLRRLVFFSDIPPEIDESNQLSYFRSAHGPSQSVAEEISRRAETAMEQLKFHCHAYLFAKELVRSENRFVGIKHLDLECTGYMRSIFRSGFVTSFPNLENVSMPRYSHGDDFRDDLMKLQPLTRLKTLKVHGSHQVGSSSPLPTFPNLENLIIKPLGDVSPPHVWSNFFSGLEKLQTLSTSGYSAGKGTLDLFTTIPSKLRELWVAISVENALLEFLDAPFLQKLEQLKVTLHSTSLSKVTDTISRSFLHLRTLHLNIFQKDDSSSPETPRINIELPVLKVLIIRECGYKPFRDTIILERCVQLKKTLRTLQMIKRPENECSAMCIDSLVENFLRDSENLEKISFSGWSYAAFKEIRERITGLRLPNLLGIRAPKKFQEGESHIRYCELCRP